MLEKATTKRSRHERKIKRYEKKYPVYGLVLNQDNTSLLSKTNNKIIPNLKTISERGNEANLNNNSISKQKAKFTRKY